MTSRFYCALCKELRIGTRYLMPGLERNRNSLREALILAGRTEEEMLELFDRVQTTLICADHAPTYKGNKYRPVTVPNLPYRPGIELELNMQTAGPSHSLPPLFPVLISKPNKGNGRPTVVRANVAVKPKAAPSPPPPRHVPVSSLKRVRSEKVDMEELEQFATHFKKERIKFGYTQGDLGQALGRRYGTDFSQTTISRFEAMNLSFKNMLKLRPVLEEWLRDAENAVSNGASFTDMLEQGCDVSSQNPMAAFIKMEANDRDHDRSSSAEPASSSNSVSPSEIPLFKKKRKRTTLDSEQKHVLDIVFKMNPRPSVEHMNDLADHLELDREVVRVWFCNHRQLTRKGAEGSPGPYGLDPMVLHQRLTPAEEGVGPLSPKRQVSDSPESDVYDDMPNLLPSSSDDVAFDALPHPLKDVKEELVSPKEELVLIKEEC